MNNRRKLIIVLGAGALAAPLASFSQQQSRVWRIGYLGDGTAAQRAADSFEPFREAMAELGYVDGRNITIEVRWTEGSAERRTMLATELVRLKVDVIVTHGLQAAQIVKAATTSIPIVVAVASDVLRSGLVASLARPGGNLTGMTDQVVELAGKEVELFKEVLPRMRRLAIMWESTNPGGVLQSDDLQAAARKLGLEVEPIKIDNADDIERAFSLARKKQVDAVVLAHTPLLVRNRAQLARLALAQRLPTMSAPSQFAEAGALMSYGPDLTKYFKRAAYFVDKILKGAKPADLPVEQPTKFELVVNLKTAKALGITIPQSILARADKVIE